MPAKRLFLILLLALLASAGTTEAKTVRSPIVQAPTGICMVRQGGGIGCFGDAVPSTVTDGYLWMRWRGPVFVSEAGGLIASVPSSARPVRLRRGDVWRKRGVTCVQRRGIKCWNRAGHGFKLTRRHYRDW